MWEKEKPDANQLCEVGEYIAHFRPWLGLVESIPTEWCGQGEDLEVMAKCYIKKNKKSIKYRLMYCVNKQTCKAPPFRAMADQLDRTRFEKKPKTKMY